MGCWMDHDAMLLNARSNAGKCDRWVEIRTERPTDGLSCTD